MNFQVPIKILHISKNINSTNPHKSKTYHSPNQNQNPQPPPSPPKPDHCPRSTDSATIKSCHKYEDIHPEQ